MIDYQNDPSSLRLQENFKREFGFDLGLDHANGTDFHYYFILNGVRYELTIRSYIERQLVDLIMYDGLGFMDVSSNIKNWRDDLSRLVHRVIDREVIGCNP